MQLNLKVSKWMRSRLIILHSIPQVPGSCGVTFELCAGLVDRDDSVENIACSEVLEETGYRIKPEDLELITVFR